MSISDDQAKQLMRSLFDNAAEKFSPERPHRPQQRTSVWTVFMRPTAPIYGVAYGLLTESEEEALEIAEALRRAAEQRA